MIVFAPVSTAEAGSETLRAQLLDMWVRVTDAGGADGFVAPADRTAVARLLDASLARVPSGENRLGVIRRDSTAVGMSFLVAGGSPLRAHWRTVLRLMVEPDLQGTGAGRILLEGLHGLAAELGLEHLTLGVRAGLGIEGFYERFGYTIVGRHPDAIRCPPVTIATSSSWSGRSALARATGLGKRPGGKRPARDRARPAQRLARGRFLPPPLRPKAAVEISGPRRGKPSKLASALAGVGRNPPVRDPSAVRQGSVSRPSGIRQPSIRDPSFPDRSPQAGRRAGPARRRSPAPWPPRAN